MECAEQEHIKKTQDTNSSTGAKYRTAEAEKRLEKKNGGSLLFVIMEKGV
jgi:hypothetical protein